MGQRAAVPVQRALHVTAGAGIVEQARGPALQGKREAVGVPVSPALFAAVERHVHRSGLAPQYGEPLARLQYTARRP